MFPFYGRKKGIIDYYPEPKYNTIIEPFSGSASYSLKYSHKNIILIEIDPCIYNIWRYLIKAKPSDILKLPLLKENETIHEERFNNLKDVEKDLIGFFIKSSCARPNKIQSSHVNYNLWNEKNRQQLAEDVKKVKHWKIVNMSYEQIPKYYSNLKNITWFIDPPYQGNGGSYYKFSNKKINYKVLKTWIFGIKGQVIVCENDEATWLPKLEPLVVQYQRGKRNREMIYQNNNIG